MSFCLYLRTARPVFVPTTDTMQCSLGGVCRDPAIGKGQ